MATCSKEEGSLTDKLLDCCGYYRDFEVELGLLEGGVEGRLASSKEFWLTKISAPLFVRNIVTYGYTLSLKAFPSQAFLNNNKSAFTHSEFVEEVIQKLLLNRCICECDTPPHVANPLTVAEGKRLRLVLDLRYVNQFLECPSFKYEDLKVLSEVFEAGYNFFTFDLESGYHHISIVERQQQLLGFSWLFRDGKRRFYTFRVLPLAYRQPVTYLRSF